MEKSPFSYPVEYTGHVSGNYTVEGMTYGDKSHKRVLYIHGGGSSNANNAIKLIEDLVSQGLCVVAPNFSESGDPQQRDPLESSSVSKRIQEVELVAKEEIPNPEQSVVVAVTMGAMVAVDIAGRLKFQKLLLVNPALYPKMAQNVPFGKKFLREIRKTDAYLKHNLNYLFEQFKKETMLIKGQDDDRDDKYINEYKKACKGLQFVELEGCGHSVIKFYDETRDPTALSVITDFIKR